ncbi:MAG: formylglycine-generating enzyme family protein [Burkholderiaceae bacterium]
MVLVPAGSYVMGSQAGDVPKEDDDPKRRVNLGRFLLSQTEITQVQWQDMMGSNPSNFTPCGGDCPVERIKWSDVQQFVQRLSEKTGKRYFVPSEAQWEYACRAGELQKYCGSDNVDAVAWYLGQGSKPQRVAQKQANAFGLYDMSGNVWEWTQDCWGKNATPVGDTYTPEQVPQCERRVIRGGGWSNFAAGVRATEREGNRVTIGYEFLGLRVARIDE